MENKAYAVAFRQLCNKAKKIATPNEIMDAADGGKKIECDCVNYALLTQQFLKMTEKFDASILNINPTNIHGEETDGHVTASVIADGYLIDPAGFPNATVKLWTPRNGETYSFEKHREDILKIYHDANLLMAGVRLDFSVDKKENEIDALYYLESARKASIYGNGNYTELMLKAYELNPGNYYAAIQTGYILTYSGEPEKAIEAFLGAANNNPNMFLAQMEAGIGLRDLDEEHKQKYSEVAYHLFLIATSLEPTAGKNAFRLIQLADDLGRTDEAKEYAKRTLPKIPKNSRYYEYIAKAAE